MKLHRAIDAGIVVIIAAVIILFVNPYLTAYLGITGMVISELVLVLAAIGAVLLRQESISDRFNLTLPTIKHFFTAAVFMLGADMWQNAASFLYLYVFGDIPDTDTAFLQEFFADVSPMIALVAIALIPAICEELLFRGFVFDSFRTKKNAVWAVAVSAVLFSVLHFAPHKILPLLVMGWALGYITAKTGSVLIPVIFHFLNNSMSLISFYTLNTEDVGQITAVIEQRSYFWYALAAFGAGSILVYFGMRLLSGKARPKWLNIIISAVSILLFVGGISGAVMDMMSVPYDGSYSSTIREDTVYTEEFTVADNSIGVAAVSLLCPQEVKGNVTITDGDAKTVYDYSLLPEGGKVLLERGKKYTVTYNFDVPEDSGVSYTVMANVTVMTVGGYEITETAETSE